jgi:hypothetical protein
MDRQPRNLGGERDDGHDMPEVRQTGRDHLVGSDRRERVRPFRRPTRHSLCRPALERGRGVRAGFVAMGHRAAPLPLDRRSPFGLAPAADGAVPSPPGKLVANNNIHRRVVVVSAHFSGKRAQAGREPTKNSRGSRSSLVTSATTRAVKPASVSTRSQSSRGNSPRTWVSWATDTVPSTARSRKA